MFGGQDDNGSVPPVGGGGTSQDDTLNGVSDLAASTPREDPSFGPMQAVSNPTTNLPTPADEVDEPEAELPEPAVEAPAEPETPAPQPSAAAPQQASDDLLEIKQQALQQLTPLVGQLEQSAEEKFRTTMMLIQASDNESLLKEAYEAAQAIEDEKVKAQALLDVINEINYFTQNKQN